MNKREKFIKDLENEGVEVLVKELMINPYGFGATCQAFCRVQDEMGLVEMQRMLTRLSHKNEMLTSIRSLKKRGREDDGFLENYSISFVPRVALKEYKVYHKDLIQTIELNSERLLQEEEVLVQQYEQTLNIKRCLEALGHDAHDGTVKGNEIESSLWHWNNCLEFDSELRKFVPITVSRMKTCMDVMCTLFLN